MGSLSLGATPVSVGRTPGNDLVVEEATVSSRHATLWVDDGGRAWVRDVGSRNGTFVNDKRIAVATLLADGDRVRMGDGVDFVLRGDVAGTPISHPLMIEDVDAGLQYPFSGDRFYIGQSDICNLRISVDAEDETAISVHPDGEVWRTTVDAEGPLAMGERFQVGDRTFRVVEVEGTDTRTQDSGPVRFEYALTVNLDGVAGPQATLTDPRNPSQPYIVDAENRAILLWVLAKRHHDIQVDPSLGTDTWCSDEDVSKGIWGRRGTADANSLHVLVHRLRKELQKAGFDPWFIEKRRKAIRVALRDVTVIQRND